MSTHKRAYYNDNDHFVCEWLKNLIAAGLITPGDVDERPIQEVTANDVKGYSRCHFFAGIAGWEYALGLAGWTDEPVWTGSCPCQPLSCAGKQLGEKDERHLWPELYRLICECGPDTIFGEQVASKDGLEWIDGISLDLENIGYAVGSIDIPAAGLGAPHIRQRLWWVADAECSRRRPQSQGRNVQHGNDPGRQEAASGPSVGSEVDNRLADAENRHGRAGERRTETGTGAEGIGRGRPTGGGDAGGVGNALNGVDGKVREFSKGAHTTTTGRMYWSQSRLIQCRDGKQRRIPAEPSLFPLADGIPNRVGILRGAGNAIVPQVAATFIRAFMEAG